MKARTPKRKRIPLAVRTAVWNTYIGENYGTGKCFTGCGTTITQSNFQCGHVQSDKYGGVTMINNLRPVCQRCNCSMKCKNMFDFMQEFGFAGICEEKKIDSENKSSTEFPNIKQLMREATAINYNPIINKDIPFEPRYEVKYTENLPVEPLSLPPPSHPPQPSVRTNVVFLY